MKALITRGCFTDHGGVVMEADNTFLVEGIPVHLEGMKHFCPKCKTVVTTMSSGRGFLMVGSQTIIMAGDMATCGATFFAQQSLVVRDNGGGSNQLSSNSLNATSPQVFDEQIVTKFHFAEGMPYFIETVDGKTLKGTIGLMENFRELRPQTNQENILFILARMLSKKES